MAITLLNLSGSTNVGHGVASDETGINVSSLPAAINASAPAKPKTRAAARLA